MNPYTLKRLLRRPWLSLLSIILTAAMCFLLCFLTDYLENQQQELETTRLSFEISCVVTTRDGTQATGLRMPSMYIGAVGEDSVLYPFIKDLQITKEFTGTIKDDVRPGMDDKYDPSITLLGVSHEKCHDSLNTSLGSIVEMFSDEEFYGSTDRVCIVSETLYRVLVNTRKADLKDMEDAGLEVTDEMRGAPYTLTIKATDPKVDPFFEPDRGKGDITLTVAGYHMGKGQTVFIPFNAAQEFAGEISNRWSCDSITFTAADNLRLEELALAASEYFGEVVPAGSLYADPPFALTIHDEQYRATLATLEQNIRRTQILLPLLLLLGFGMGFLVSFLATRGEKRSYALMRTQGLTRGKLLFSILAEQTVLPLAAAVIIGSVFGNVLPAIMYLVCHCVGCTLVAVKAVRVPPTAILREQE